MNKTTSCSELSVILIGNSLKLTTTGPGVGEGGKRQTSVFGDQYWVGIAAVSPNTHVSPSYLKKATL